MSDAKISARRSRPDELFFLQAKLAQRKDDGFEQISLAGAHIIVAEQDGILAGMAAARLRWQVQPLMLFPEWERHATPIAKKRAVHKLGTGIADYVLGPENLSGVRVFFAYVDDPAFAELLAQPKLEERYGLRADYEGQILIRGGAE